MKRKSCICGRSIGKSGMGRERLEHLMDVLEDKRSRNSRWEDATLWTTDTFISKIESQLSQDTPGGEEINGYLKALKRSRKVMLQDSVTEDSMEIKNKLVEAIRDHERNKILLGEARSRREDLKRTEVSCNKEIKKETASMKKRSGYDISIDRMNKSLDLLNGSLDRLKDITDERIVLFRRSIEEAASNRLNILRPSAEERIVIHSDSMQIGLEREEKEGKRTIPLWRLSAGERETVIIALITSLSELTGMNLIMDSPFSNMERTTIKNALELIRGQNGVLVMIPSGSISKGILKEDPEERERHIPGMDICLLEMREGGSFLRGCN